MIQKSLSVTKDIQFMVLKREEAEEKKNKKEKVGHIFLTDLFHITLLTFKQHFGFDFFNLSIFKQYF